MGTMFQPRFNFGTVKAPVEVAGDDDEKSDGDNGEGLPSPHLVKVTARRMAGLKEATQALDRLPDIGESLHVVCTARHDLTDTLAALMTKLGPVDRLLIATLNFNDKNLRSLLIWLDEGTVKSCGLVASLFFAAHKKQLASLARSEFRERGQRIAFCHSHAKVISISFASGVRMSISGSANLSGNGSGREQFELTNDAGLAEWHAGWITELLDRHEGREPKNDATQATAD